MKKKSLKTFCIFYIFSVSISFFSQTNESVKLKISYGIEVHFDKESEVYKIFEKFTPGLNKRKKEVASEIDFTLLLNDTTSFFYLEKKLYSDLRAANSVLTDVNYFGRIKQQGKNYITEELEEAFGKFLVIRPYQEWKLESETKQIGDYLCFKATTFYTIITPQNKVFKHDFTAWYAPELPYRFGPAGYGNLPGLIIELQGKNFTYGVKKIEFFNDQNKKNFMPKLKKKRLITEEEFEKLAAEDEERWRSKRNKK